MVFEAFDGLEHGRYPGPFLDPRVNAHLADGRALHTAALPSLQGQPCVSSHDALWVLAISDTLVI